MWKQQPEHLKASPHMVNLISRRFVNLARRKADPLVKATHSAKHHSNVKDFTITSIKPAKRALVGVRAFSPNLDVQKLKHALLVGYAKSLREKEQLLQVKPPKKQLPVPSVGEIELVNQVFNQARQTPNNIASKIKRIELKFSDLLTLYNQKWLNDQVIDGYLQLITENTNCFAFSTHFYSRLETGGYNAVSRWAKRQKVNVFKVDKVFIPVNQGNMHWTLAVVDNKNEEIGFFDSLGGAGAAGKGSREVELVYSYLQSEAKRLNVVLPNYGFSPAKECPKQRNGFDCGVFVCATCLTLAKNLLPQYTQSDIPNMRIHMCASLKGAKLSV